MTAMEKALVLTVGTGNVEDIEKSLIEPLKKSIAQGEWSRIVLLPSTISRDYAERLQHEGPHGEILVEPLRSEGDEYDPDTCFVHFDQVLTDLMAKGFRAENITVDFTRGTKVMSAALVLAATRHGIPRLRYVTGDQRDARHMVVPGTERIRDGSTTQVTARRQMDTAQSLMENGNFAAVLDILPNPDPRFAALIPDNLRPELAGMRSVAAFYEARDRLDFAAADEGAKAAVAATLPARWHHLRVTQAAAVWVHRLAEDTEREQDLRKTDHQGMALHVGRLSAELIANGRRRSSQHQFEDANIRAYRVVELLGQARLFERGYDSERMPGDDADVGAFIEKMRKNGSHDIRPANKDASEFSFPREKVARFLKSRDDQVGKQLVEEGQRPEVKARNNSILIHGFRTTGPTEQQPLNETFDRLASLLSSAFPDHAGKWLAMAATVPSRSTAPPTP